MTTYKFLNTASAFIFDLDGTLLDTEPQYTEATQSVLDPYGHTYTLALKKRVMGGDSYRSAELTIAEFGLPFTPKEFLEARERFLVELFPHSPEISGAGEFLHQSSLLGRKLGLATSSHQHLCDLKLTNRTWRSIFGATVCGDDSALQAGKPAPDIFLLCAQRLGVNPGDVVAFEDSKNGVLAAKAAGMCVVAISSPYADAADLAAADYMIDGYEELVAQSNTQSKAPRN